MIQFQNVTKLYKTVIGVNDINLDLAPGAYGLLGPNGSGKTTFINLITGQLQPTLGTVRILGTDPWKDSSLLAQIGLCPAVDLLMPKVSGFEWVQYLMILQGFEHKDAQLKAEAALETVRMTNAMHRPIGSYSLGMRQRCKLAQAIAHEPDLLILDEPFNGLDPVGRHEMTEVLQGWTRNGRSFLLASHLLHEVEALNPSLLLISGGRLLASGTAKEVRALLVDLPNQFHMKTDEPERLAPILCAIETVDSVRINRSGKEVEVATRSAVLLSETLPPLLKQHQIKVTEIRSNDGSLQELFSSLMKIHRGQL